MEHSAEIAAASGEQTQGIGQINTAVTAMDKVTQQVAANAEESTSTSEDMSAQSEQMQTVADQMSVMVSGTRKHAENGLADTGSPWPRIHCNARPAAPPRSGP